jgi:hypothetical protein
MKDANGILWLGTAIAWFGAFANQTFSFGVLQSDLIPEGALPPSQAMTNTELSAQLP